MTWWQTMPAFAVAGALYFIPGILILAAAGVRRLNLAALSAPVSFSVASCLAVIAPFLGLEYSPTLFLICSVIIALGIGGARVLLNRRKGLSRHSIDVGPRARGHLGGNGALGPTELGRLGGLLAIPVGLAVAAIIITGRYVRGFGNPENFSQTFDNIYHLNAIEHIVSTGNGSSLSIGNLTDTSAGFYPAGMHDMIALVQILSGAPVTIALNVSTILTGALVWPLGCMFLISRLVGYRPIPLLLTGALAGSFSAFPYLMVAFGVLYPYHTAIALLPVVLGLVIEALGVSRVKPSSIWPPLLAFGLVFPGLALTHPSMVVALLGFAAPAVLARFIVSYRSFINGTEPKQQTLVWAGVTLTYAVATVVAWSVLRPGLGAAPWTPFQSNARAIGEVLASAPMGTTTAWILLPLAILGIYVISRHMRTHWWLLGIYLIGAFLYIIVSSWAPGTLRTLVAGVWYNDSFRLAALLPIVSLPVIVLGAEWVIRRVRLAVSALFSSRLTRTSPGVERTPLGALSALGVGLATWTSVLLLGFASQGGTLASVQDRLNNIFAQHENSALVDTSELSVINQVANIVPGDNVVVADPLTGGSLVYAFGDRETIAPHVFGERSEKEQYLLDHWDEAAYNTEVCPIIRELNAYYALDFGDTTVIPTEDSFPGLDDLTTESAPGMETVVQEGDARLVRTTACG